MLCLFGVCLSPMTLAPVLFLAYQWLVTNCARQGPPPLAAEEPAVSSKPSSDAAGSAPASETKKVR